MCRYDVEMLYVCYLYFAILPTRDKIVAIWLKIHTQDGFLAMPDNLKRLQLHGD